MPRPVVVDIPHELGRDGARQRLQNGFGKIREQFGFTGMAVEERWEGDRLYFSANGLGQKVVGRVDVMEKLARIELDLPWALAILADRLQGRIKSAGVLLLEKK